MQSTKENEHIIALATPADISVKLLHLNKPLQVEVDNNHLGELNMPLKLLFKTC